MEQSQVRAGQEQQRAVQEQGRSRAGVGQEQDWIRVGVVQEQSSPGHERAGELARQENSRRIAGAE